ncbi:MAG: T9SS type A sorting domain-containing protein, partial [Candidatus Marinimicrobia bacterium]|nr:T9SS type A sorting domain-containing protein [Candidatus Neomarinimicrobiota bacterium]MCF7841174.1 T9SS type A sorting domain-containing protein [Candidatus Neomarinimicrobiota bacterium]
DPSTGWTHYMVAEQAPETATGISVRARFNPNTTGAAYFDDFSVEKMVVSTTSIAEEPVRNQRPSEYLLTQNYPNPFNPSTHIRFSCPSAGWVRLEIYNLMGQHIKTLVNQEMREGTYEVIWNADNDYGEPIASGVYLYNLITQNGTISQKMVLMR